MYVVLVLANLLESKVGQAGRSVEIILVRSPDCSTTKS